MKTLILLSFLFLTACSSNPKVEPKPLSPEDESTLRGVVINLREELQASREEIAKLQNKIEEVEHFTNKKIDESSKKNSDNIAVLQSQVSNLQAFQETQNLINQEVSKVFEKHENLLIEIDQNFANFRKNNTPVNVDVKQALKKATELFSETKYEEALDAYSFFLDKPHVLTRDEYQIVLYRVALSEYRLERREESLIHFSQLYEKFHKENDKYMASSLFHIGSILHKEGKCGEAIKILEQIVVQYKHQYFKDEAKKKMKEIKDSKNCKLKITTA